MVKVWLGCEPKTHYALKATKYENVPNIQVNKCEHECLPLRIHQRYSPKWFNQNRIVFGTQLCSSISINWMTRFIHMTSVNNKTIRISYAWCVWQPTWMFWNSLWGFCSHKCCAKKQITQLNLHTRFATFSFSLRAKQFKMERTVPWTCVFCSQALTIWRITQIHKNKCKWYGNFMSVFLVVYWIHR